MHRPCPSCGHLGTADLVAEVRLLTPDDHPLQGGYPVVSCTRCGAGFADVVVPLAFYEEYYANVAKYAELTSDPDVVPAEPTWQTRKSIEMAARIHEVLQSPSARILDVGCATGSLLLALHLLGYEDLVGVDPSPEAVRIANLSPGIRAAVGSLADLPTDLGLFDCVCMTGVLEHLWEPAAAVRALRGYLKPGGLLWLAVPNAEQYLDPYLAPFEDFSTEHINHFSLSTLDVLASRTGMTSVYESTYLAPLTAAIATSALAVAWTATHAPAAKVVRDTGLSEALRSYADRSTADYEEIVARLGNELEGTSEFILWGVGETAFKLLATTPLASRKAVAIVDSNPSRYALRFSGLPVIPPQELHSSTTPIVVASLVRAESIAAASAALGLQNPVVRVDRQNWEPSAPIGAVGPTS
jgi:2-polyprenyl-3-methyl-5-hydroxy-6-metoxy-1,4-benzoquinol methylase